jgi:hydrogenase maturation protease
MANMVSKHITILGIGNFLFRDEGVGVRVIQELQERYAFSDNVSVVDGGVLGLDLLGIISKADHLIVFDAVKNKERPGEMYRLAGDAIPARIRAKTSLHQVDFLEALAVCQAPDKVPETVILGVEPEDIESFSVDLIPAVQTKVEMMIDRVLAEMDRLGAAYQKRSM